MIDYDLAFSIIGSFFGIIALFPYVRDVFRATTKSHPFTWFVWALINVIAFFAQLAGGAGIGAAITGVVAFECFVIAVFSLWRGEKRIVALDWWCLFGALTGVVLWRVTQDPFIAVVFVVIADAVCSVPTFRKSYWRPNEETVSSYVLGAIRAVFGLLALASFNPTTALYPAFTLLSDAAISVLLFVRRRTQP